MNRIYAPPLDGPALGFLALAPTVLLFTLNHAGLIGLDPVALTFVLLVGGATQVVAGLQSRQAGKMASAAAFIPLGLFWFSMVGFCQLPALGVGRAPSSLTLMIYFSMWALFAAILYLGSFRQSRVQQLVFSLLMISLLLLAVSEIRNNAVFSSAAAVAGILCGLAALYNGVAKGVNRGLGRYLLPVGKVATVLDAATKRKLSN
jgi:succinate-acetate transporter protein